MSDGHLYLTACGGVDYTDDGRHSWYDPTHQSVLVLSPRSGTLRQLALDASLDPAEAASSTSSTSTAVTSLYDFTEPENKITSHAHSGDHKANRRHIETPIVLLQLSADRQFLAIQRSDIEVEVVHRHTRKSYWVLCKSKAGNRILHGGVLWNTHSSHPNSSQDLFLVTKLGLEQYRVSTKRRSCALHRTMGLYVHEFWYASSHGVLLVSSGSRANEIVTFLLRGANAEKLPRLVFSTSVSKQDLHLVSLYGDMYAVYSDTRSSKLLLYLVGRTKVTCVRSLNLMLPPGTALEFSVVDNLLVCHSLDFNVSLFFDVMCDGNISDPFSSPLPISSQPPGHHPQSNTAPVKATIDAIAVDKSKTFGEVDEEVLEAIDDDSGEDSYGNTEWGSPQPTLSIRRALSVDDLEVHKYMDEVSLSPPSFKTSPVTHLASRRSARRLQRAMSVATLGNVGHTNHEAVVPGLARWRFHAPNFVQRSFTVDGCRDLVEQVDIRKLQVNLSEVYKTCEHHRDILPFLLRRGDHELAKCLALKLVRNHIVEQQISLSLFEQLLSTVQSDNQFIKAFVGTQPSNGSHNMDTKNSGNISPLTAGVMSPPPTRNATGCLLIRQADFHRYVWSGVLQDRCTAKRCHLSAYIIEYIKNLRDSKVAVESITYTALAESFIAIGEPSKLYQFLHYHVVADSTELADLMVRNGRAYPALMQLGLDMYFRLGAMSPLVCTLLDLGQIDQAIQISWRNVGLNSCDASVIPAAVFFESLVKAVSSSGEQSCSSLQVTQMLGNLLLFLKLWDPQVLRISNTTSLSTLASTVTVQFPDDLVPSNCRVKLRAAFGFATE